MNKVEFQGTFNLYVNRVL